MRHVSRLSVAALVLLAGGAKVQADSVYQVTGTFGYENAGSTGLVDGSFTATFEVAGLPLGSGDEAYFDSYSVSVYRSGGALQQTFGSSTPYMYGYIMDLSPSVPYVFAVLASTTSSAHLSLQFASPFTGTGAVIPTESTFPPYTSIYSNGLGGYVTVATGQSVEVASVPEPSSVVLAMAALVVAAGRSIARRRIADRRSHTYIRFVAR